MLIVSWGGCCRRSKHDGDEAEENVRGGHGAQSDDRKARQRFLRLIAACHALLRRTEPSYQGYVAWTVERRQLAPHTDAVVFMSPSQLRGL